MRRYVTKWKPARRWEVVELGCKHDWSADTDDGLVADEDKHRVDYEGVWCGYCAKPPPKRVEITETQAKHYAALADEMPRALMLMTEAVGLLKDPAVVAQPEVGSLLERCNGFIEAHRASRLNGELLVENASGPPEGQGDE